MEKVHVSVIDGFDVTLKQGRASILPKGRKEIAIIAILACSKGMRATREHLCETLWSDRDVYQARTSLRQALSRIRRRHSIYREIVGANKIHVSLDKLAVSVDFDLSGGNTELPSISSDRFLKGIDQPDPAFSNWLVDSRNRIEKSVSSVSISPAPEADFQKINADRSGLTGSTFSITLANPATDVTGSNDSMLARNWALDNILYWTTSLEFTEVYDQRSLPAGGSEYMSISDSCFMVYVSVYVVDGHQQCFIRMVDALTNRLEWCSSKTGKAGISFESSVTEIVLQFVDYLFLLFRKYDGELLADSIPSLVGARSLHAILNPGRTTIKDIEMWLNKGLERDPSGLKYAITGLLEALRFGEDLEPIAALDQERIKRLLSLAVEYSPTNATVLAIVGHVHGYVLGNTKRALKMTHRAIELQANNPLCHVFHSLALHYDNRDQRALNHAIVAYKLGGYSMSRTLINSVVGSMYVVAGDMERATFHAEDAYEVNPTFRPVLNTLLISYSHAGDPQGAENILESLRNQDSNFSYGSVNSREYPVKNTTYRDKLCSTVQFLKSS